MTSVSIIICTRNRIEPLRNTLDSLAETEIPYDYSVELILLDNASTDGTAQLAQTATLPNLRLRYLYEGRPGKSYGLNSALRAAGGEIILWTDDDVRVPRHWIADMCGPINNGEADITAGEVSLAPHLERGWMTEFHRIWLGDTATLPKDRLPFGVNMAFHRRVLDTVPDLDTDLGPGTRIGSGEEILFVLQLKEAGFRILTAPPVVEHHFDPARLLYNSWKKRAKIEGRIGAYYGYHWYHGEVRFAGLRALYKTIQLAWLRFFRRAIPENQEGCDVQELQLIKHLEFFRGYSEEQKKPRKYERRGLVTGTSTASTTLLG
jgi:glycosyltransferase involved in cell wall biosynthesis